MLHGDVADRLLSDLHVAALEKGQITAASLASSLEAALRGSSADGDPYLRCPCVCLVTLSCARILCRRGGLLRVLVLCLAMPHSLAHASSFCALDRGPRMGCSDGIPFARLYTIVGQEGPLQILLLNDAPHAGFRPHHTGGERVP